MKIASYAELAPALRTFPAILPGAAVVILYALFYGPLVPSLVTEWYEHQNFSYGFLIPVIFVFLVWQEREVFQQVSANSRGFGAVSLSTAVLIGVIGKILGEPFIGRISMVLALVSMVHLFWGWQCVKRVAFPFTYLFLMIPPPYVMVKQIAYHLRMFDASIAAGLLPLIGVPVYQNSYFLYLPNVILEVADVCSGTASLFAMAALGTIYAYYLPARPLAKAGVLVGAVVFPVLANLFRIILIGASVYYYGPIMLEAFFHYFSGTFTFLLALCMLLLLGEYLRRRYPRSSREQTVGKVSRPDSRQAVSRREVDPQDGGLARPFLIAVTVLGLALYVSNSPAASRAVPLADDLETVSQQLGPYRSVERQWSDFYVDQNAERSLSRIYEAPHEDPIELFIGYRGYQNGEDRLISPKLIFPEKWEYASMDHTSIVVGGYRTIDAIWLDTKKGPERRLVLYWYQLRGQAFASDVRYRFEQLRGAILQRRSDGAVIRLATPLREYEAAEQAKKRLEAFAAYLYPELVRLLPQ